MLQKIQSSYKALTVFLLGFASFLAATNADPAIAGALPQGFAQWLTMVGIPAVLGAATYLKRNEYTVDEAAELLRRAQARAAGEKPAT
jgi:hypothetical protein